MKSLPINLATHPHERRVRLRRRANLALGGVLLLTAVHVGIAARLASIPEPPPEDPLPVAEALAAWRDEVDTLAAAAAPRRSMEVARSVAVANELIAQRAFPWGEVFALLEEALPDDVRLESVQPAITPDGVRVSLVAASASDVSLRTFLAGLEGRDEFEAVYPVRQEAGDDGVYRFTVQAWHRGLNGARGGR